MSRTIGPSSLFCVVVCYISLRFGRILLYNGFGYAGVRNVLEVLPMIGSAHVSSGHHGKLGWEATLHSCGPYLSHDPVPSICNNVGSELLVLDGHVITSQIRYKEVGDKDPDYSTYRCDDECPARTQIIFDGPEDLCANGGSSLTQSGRKTVACSTHRGCIALRTDNAE